MPIFKYNVYVGGGATENFERSPFFSTYPQLNLIFGYILRDLICLFDIFDQLCDNKSRVI